MTRKEILQQLADKQISREEAERRLNELGSPLPEELPALPPGAQTRKSSAGCLIALLIGFALCIILFVLMFFVRASTHSRMVNDIHIQMEHKAQETLREAFEHTHEEGWIEVTPEPITDSGTAPKLAPESFENGPAEAPLHAEETE